MEELSAFWVEYAVDAPHLVAAKITACDTRTSTVGTHPTLALGVFATDPTDAAFTANGILAAAAPEAGAAATLAPIAVRPRPSSPGAPQRVDALPPEVEAVTLDAPDGTVVRVAHEGGLGRWAVERDGAVLAGRDLRAVLAGALDLDWDDPFVLQALRELLGAKVSGAWRYRCPCCEAAALTEAPPGTYDVCGRCGWEDDPVQFDDPSFAGGANVASLAEARARWARRRAT